MFACTRGTSRLQEKAFKSQDVQHFVRSHGNEWKINIPRSSCKRRGFFERMVRYTKGCFKKTLNSARLTYEDLIAVLTEIGSVLNSRPLTYVYKDKIEEALTPSHLMLGKILLPNDSVTQSVVGQSQLQ